MPAFDATVGGASATSYITREVADGLMPVLTTSERSQAWLALSDSDRELWLMKSTRMLEIYFDWEGERCSDYQALAWPREWVRGPDRVRSIPSDVIPDRVKEAEALLALLLSEGFSQEDSAAAPLDYLKVSSVAMSFSSSKASRASALVPSEIIEMLRGYGNYAGPSGMARSVSLERG